MKTKLLLLLGLSLCCMREQTAKAHGPPPNADPLRLREIVQAQAQKAGTKAVEFGIWVDDREILTTALGDSMTTVPATTDMHYRIGGIAETFMSTLLLMLVEQQRISLYDKISRWFPNLLGADQVTVEMLVSNTAGYIDYVTVDDFQRLQLAEPFRTFTDDELINYSVRDGKMNFLPGTSQQYSHTDNVILGQVIQRATKQSIKELYDENIFDPMGMKDTSSRSIRISRARCCTHSRRSEKSTRIAPTGTRSGARRQRCPPPTFTTSANGARSSGQVV
jgi:CubicO group peptidase (beta-lactamase class C family)